MSELYEIVQANVEKLTAAATSRDVAEVARVADVLLAVDHRALAIDDPASVRVLLDAAGILSEVGDLKRTEWLLIKGINALAENPRASRVDLVIPYNNLMAVYDQAGRPTDRDHMGALIGGLAQAIDEPLPINAMLVFLQLGGLCHEKGLTEAALTMYRPVHRYMTTESRISPDALWNWLLRYGAVLHKGGRHDQAVDVLRLAISVHKRRPSAQAGDQIPALLGIAAAASAQGHRSEAQEALERAVGVAGDVPSPEHLDAAVAANHNLGTLYIELDRPDRHERAEEAVRHALALVLGAGGKGTAQHADELCLLGFIAYDRGDLDVAEQRYMEAIDIYRRAPGPRSPQLSDCLTDLGTLRLKQGRAPEAVDPLRRAMELRSEETGDRRAEALSNLATAHFEAADYVQASREYWEATDLRLDT